MPGKNNLKPSPLKINKKALIIVVAVIIALLLTRMVVSALKSNSGGTGRISTTSIQTTKKSHDTNTSAKSSSSKQQFKKQAQRDTTSEKFDPNSIKKDSEPRSHGLITLVGTLTDTSDKQATVIVGNSSKISFSLNESTRYGSDPKGTINSLKNKKVQAYISIEADGTFMARRITEVK